MKNRILAFKSQIPRKSFTAIMSTTLETPCVFTHLFKIRKIYSCMMLTMGEIFEGRV